MPSSLIVPVVGAVVGGLLSDDNGAEVANGAAADSTRLQSEIAQDQWNQYKRIYQPMEETYVNDAQNFDSPENYAKAAGSASATVASQFGKARDQLTRTPGLDPSSGAYQAGMTNLGLSEAASGAVAQNAARQGVKDQAYTMKTNALNLGKGLPGTASQGLGQAAGLGLYQARGAQAQSNVEAQALGQVFTPDTLMGIGRGASDWLGNNKSSSGAFVPDKAMAGYMPEFNASIGL